MKTRIAVLLMLAMMLAFSASALAQEGRPEVRHKEIQFTQLTELPQFAFTISEILTVPLDHAEPFLAVGAIWKARGEIRLSLRSSNDGTTWDDWLPMNAHSDFADERGEQVGALAFLDQKTRFVQYLLSAKEQATVFNLRLVFISPGATPREMQRRIEQRANEVMTTETLQQPKYPKPPVVTRTEWGCPDGQITTHGSLSYTTVTHLIVHHTFSPSGSINGDWAAAVRSIWNFHVFSNGWADIGYNYVIDQTGVIYEGRAGGDNVIGAHFSGVNSGTMGVVVIGDFTSVTPPPAALNSLKKLLAWKADQRGIDPTGKSRHAASGLELNNISGHRDGPGATECPGDAFYPMLPGIRTDVKSLLANVDAIASVSAASFNASALASASIVAAFGDNLASSVQIGSSSPLPVSLAGTSVTIRDSANVEKIARLFFVSPGQINFLMPDGLATGAATILVANGEGKLAAGTVNIAAVAPALFSANSNGREVAAAVVLRIRADGSQTYEQVAAFDPTQNKFVAIPIDLGAETEQVFFVGYGTGIRGRSALSAVEVKIGGISSEVLYAGITEGFFGLDQINARIPRSLIGKGDVDLELTVDGVNANVLKLRIR
ncbi:MAG: N-acetylmuramoyl-L-alanine amidase [Acidobacteria bacterium]|nr:N-acetylmuramoyl-L-alanine amidase [Acidobacteriota bacterium]